MTDSETSLEYEAVIIGSGFGGAIACCRLARKWNDKVLLLERGKRYPMGAFPRSPDKIADNFWNLPEEACPRPRHIRNRRTLGMFDIRNYQRMDTVVCAGYGGGSLIYANVFLEPPDAVFAQGWPRGIDKNTLAPYYQVARTVLGARPIPSWNDVPRRRIRRTELFQSFASKEGRSSKLADICVFFGNDPDNPTPIGVQERNRYGAVQTSSTYCGECDVGCNTHSKNTVDLNYLYVAEHHHQARIRTECLVDKIVPLNEQGKDDASADGSKGYRIYYRDLKNDTIVKVTSQRVVVSAGTLGTNELLLRCRDQYGTLPRLSPQLGKRFSGNGDFLGFVIQGADPADPNYGPVITQYTDFNLFDDFQRDHAFILEDASYPAFASWFAEGVRPWVDIPGMARKFVSTVVLLWDRLVENLLRHRKPWIGSVGYLFHQLLKGDLSSHSSVLLCMGLDRSDGELFLKEGRMELNWPQDTSMSLYQAIVDCGRRFRTFARARRYLPLPTWSWPVRNNITVHPLGGCTLADDPDHGVVSADPSHRGEAFGYRRLYVADGSVLPTAVGANPVATISAVSEWIAEGITGLSPDAGLGMSQKPPKH